MRTSLGWFTFPRVGSVKFGSFRRVTPMSRVFGLDRGRREECIDIHFIEQYLAHHANEIRGRVLEIGDNTYSSKFGAGRVTRSDVLHVDRAHPTATIIGDLTASDGIPSNAFDCVICTQTLQFIYDVRAALRTLYRILRPGGVLFLTCTGISQISRYDMERWGDYWRFTTRSMERLLREFWPADCVTLEAHGNPLLAMAYLHGLTVHEFTAEELSHRDPDYELVITVRAVKPVDGMNARDSEDEPEMIARGWDQYARNWDPTQFRILPEGNVRHLGDEWTSEDPGEGATNYGLPALSAHRFSALITEKLFDVHLPKVNDEGLEVGSGGGRITALLLPRTKLLHVAEPSVEMLQKLKARFSGTPSLRMHHTDGVTLPTLTPSSLDFVVSFDVFVHFEPRLIFWYLRQMRTLLRPGGVGVIHYSDVLSPIGWRQFELDLERNLKRRTYFASFGVMCTQLMEQFLKVLDYQVISANVGLIPRDAVTVFLKPH